MRRLLLALFLAGCFLGAAACGGNDEGGAVATSTGAEAEDGAGPGTAVEDTVAAGTARFEIVATIETGGKELDLDAKGETNLGEDRTRMDIDFSALAEVAGGGEAADPALYRGEAIYDGEVLYIRLPALTAALPEEVDWLRVDASTLAEQAGQQFNAPDPTEFIRFVDAMKDAEEVGEEEIRGDQTTHFRGTVAVSDLAAAATEEDRAEATSFAERLEAAGVESFPLDLWLDEENRVRQLRVEYEAQQEGTEVRLLTVVELFDYGEEADIEPPPANEVTNFDDIAGRGAEETEHSEP